MTTTDVLLAVDQLKIRVGSHGPLAVNDLSFTIAPGEIVALVGESGSGKTMAARAAIGLLPPPLEHCGGQVRFQGHDLNQLTPEQLRALRGAKIGMVFQEPMVSLNPSMSIGEQMAEGLRLHTLLSDAQIRQRSLEMLGHIGIKDAERCLAAYPHEFSGGMRQRIMLASVMLLRPALLIADEPTTALDCLAQLDVLKLMLELTREQGTAILFISHDLSLVARYADKVVVMREGRAVEQGSIQQILLAPKAEYTRQLLEALPRRGELAELPKADGPLLTVRDVCIEHPGPRSLWGRSQPKRVVHSANLTIAPGETLALVGGSGSGKTTLGRAIVGLNSACAGAIEFEGVDILKAGNREHRLQCQMIFQDPYSSLDPRMKIGDILAEPLRHVPGMTPAQKRERVTRTLADIGLAEQFVDRFPHQLSGGQRQRVAIGRALVRHPRLVIADEPISALDMTIQKQILELFERLQAQYGFACLFISHDLAAVERIAHRVAVMSEGRVVEMGSRDEIFDRPQHPYTRKLLAAASPLEKLDNGGYRIRPAPVPLAL
ncbi:ABC transporter ATP-binding protein [Pseudomonas gingeri NCPPB 3146 = LMG 5327]|uniref:ABC-type dipeptide transporter n=2 Tax=Pseudomonas gingeri TaxID=117681 RepID=A0A7Y8CC21_9PSED|nr:MULTISPECIES: ABC transporter ATP-binding protein [Pseudomonas]NVZ28513.1 ABC transporter ATP-binding protein [Pseudomonas gingeri]NWA08979.1 ABC transporter ATP-binding protein [Pseudomonas gingeri]NWC12522.1 ABC transporter ATP-binding protein [Pseudomonas gingeri]NWE27344.1 ABC transporter ATP-binding protein [Pseudomonas gingeri]NWE48549.1 ABC transporter ATP-binding protein [Pseudomonas gingeri]